MTSLVWNPYFFLFKNAPTILCLSRDKTKRQSDKNTIVTPTKTLPKKYGNSHVDFQIVLSTLSKKKILFYPLINWNE